MLLMGLIWLRVPEKSEFILCVMWEAFAQMLALQEGSAVAG
jgi:hypothetical protein